MPTRTPYLRITTTLRAERPSGIGVTDDLAGQVSAVELVKAAVATLGGHGGGGRPDMAQGGGPDGNKAHEALEAVKDALEKVAA